MYVERLPPQKKRQFLLSDKGRAAGQLPRAGFRRAFSCLLRKMPPASVGGGNGNPAESEFGWHPLIFSRAVT